MVLNKYRQILEEILLATQRLKEEKGECPCVAFEYCSPPVATFQTALSILDVVKAKGGSTTY